MKPRTITAVCLAAIAGVLMIYQGYKSMPKAYEKTFSKTEVPPEWRPDVVEAVERMAIAATDGRVKSVNTFAHYELLRARGYAGMELKVEGQDKKRSWTPTAWLLDLLFYPKLAEHYPVFVVEDSEVVAKLGIKPHEKQRDRYTFHELNTGRAALAAAMQRLQGKKEEDKDRIERLTSSLAENFMAYESLAQALAGAHNQVTLGEDVEDPALKAMAGKPIPVMEAMAAFATCGAWKDMMAKRKAGEPVAPPPWMRNLVEELLGKMGTAGALRWYPPTATDKENWETANGLVNDLTEEGLHAPTAADKLRELALMGALATDPQKNGELQDRLKAFAESRIGEAKKFDHYNKIELDRTYLKYHIFSYVTRFFIALFFLTAISWLLPPWPLLRKILARLCLLGFAGIAAGMTQRVFITGWGPVTGIHETLPYITIIGGLFALLLMKYLKNPLPLAMAVVIGAAGMFFTSQHELLDSRDTMPALNAVLRTNFWLWTHVTTINIGYATVIIGAFFSMAYLFSRMFDIMRKDSGFFRDLTRTAYGVLCFGMFFSLIGTILGGIWGNESWGRFWGWDPKENGALLITVWCLFVMHMRMAGWVKEFGFHFWNAAAALPVMFSWWHVNLLNIGLHSYGFTEGLLGKLYIAYGITALVLIIGLIARFAEHIARKQMTATGAEKQPEPPSAPASAESAS